MGALFVCFEGYLIALLTALLIGASIYFSKWILVLLPLPVMMAFMVYQMVRQ
jgi:hypothetical protein